MTPTAEEQLATVPTAELQFHRTENHLTPVDPTISSSSTYQPLLPHLQPPSTHFLPELPLQPPPETSPSDTDQDPNPGVISNMIIPSLPSPSSPPPDINIFHQHQLLPHLISPQASLIHEEGGLIHPTPLISIREDAQEPYLGSDAMIYSGQQVGGPGTAHEPIHQPGYYPYLNQAQRHYLNPYIQQTSHAVYSQPYSGLSSPGLGHGTGDVGQAAPVMSNAGGGMILTMTNGTAHLPGYGEVTNTGLQCHPSLERAVYPILPTGLELPCRDGRDGLTMPSPEPPDGSQDPYNFPREGLECLVCGDTAACQHYGVRSCEGCKGFFKRSIQRSAKYTCLQNGNCVIDKKRRNRCQHCRFNKCLQVGMVREVVRTESLKGRRGRLSSKAKGTSSDAGLSPSVTLLSMLNRVHENSQPVSRLPVKADLHPHEAGDAWSKLLRILTESMNALQNDYASHLPGFDKFSESDQRIILQIHGMDLVTLRLAYRLFKSSSVFLMENGENLDDWVLQACGLDYWRSAILELSSRLENLLREDDSAFSGMSALTLMNYKPDVDGVHLRNTAESYALHHRLIEVLKSHCCITSPLNGMPTLPNNSNHDRLATSLSSTSTPQQQQDPTYFSRILAEKEESRRITLELLLRPMANRLDLCPDWLQQAMLMNRVVTVPQYQ